MFQISKLPFSVNSGKKQQTNKQKKGKYALFTEFHNTSIKFHKRLAWRSNLWQVNEGTLIILFHSRTAVDPKKICLGRTQRTLRLQSDTNLTGSEYIWRVEVQTRKTPSPSATLRYQIRAVQVADQCTCVFKERSSVKWINDDEVVKEFCPVAPKITY